MTAQTADFLASVPMFSGLQRDELLKFAELTRERTYPKGSVILFQGDPGDSLYVLRQGRAKVVLIGEDGREVILGVLEPGAHFGELALIDDQPRSAHVIAMEDSQLLILRREDFRRRVEANPSRRLGAAHGALPPPPPRRPEDRRAGAAGRPRAASRDCCSICRRSPAAARSRSR